MSELNHGNVPDFIALQSLACSLKPLCLIGAFFFECETSISGFYLTIFITRKEAELLRKMLSI